MVNMTLKTIMILALAGSTLSGCSLIGSAADTAWGGTKTVARWVYSPVRYVLRGSPDSETQFAGTEETEAGEIQLAEVEADSAETSMAEAEMAVAEPFTQTVSTVSVAPVVAVETIETEVTTYSAEIIQAAFASGSHYTIKGSGGTGTIHFVRLQGESSTSDWMDCQDSSDGYWVTSRTGGSINPAFEVCMRKMDYVLETELASYDTVDVSTETVAMSEDGPIVMAGGLEGSNNARAVKSAYATPTKAPTSTLPDRF